VLELKKGSLGDLFIIPPGEGDKKKRAGPVVVAAKNDSRKKKLDLRRVGWPDNGNVREVERS